MLRGFYTAASGMMTQMRNQEAITNNIANANTPGYKGDQATIRAFPEMLIQQAGSSNLPVTRNVNVPYHHPIGSINTGVYVQEFVTDFSQGPLEETGKTTDMALVNGELPDETGGLFFTVQNADGEPRYTRNGNFTVDGEGFLVTNQGYYVLDATGEPIETGGMEFNVTQDGVLEVPGAETELGIRYVPDVNDLIKEGNDVFAGESEPVPAGATYTTRQGFLEQSNVNELQAMTEAMNAYRIFETNQRVLRAYDESMSQAVSDIGRVN